MDYLCSQGVFVLTSLTRGEGFLFFFLSLAASIDGWHHYRPVISVNGSFFKLDFGGTMLIKVTLDENNHIFPLAFAIVDSENDKS